MILTEMLTNTTVTEIVNEIKGADDKANDPLDTDKDYIRRVQVTDVRVSLITRSFESVNLYKDSLIVVSKNEEENALEN